MNKLAKGFLIASAAVMLFVVLIAFGINLYVESQGVQVRLEAALSEQLHIPVKLAEVHFTPWGGLKLVGFSVSAVSTGAKTQPDFVNSPLITARIFWRPLLSRRLIVRELLVSQPTVVWVQTASGSWSLPGGGRLQLPTGPEPKQNGWTVSVPPEISGTTSMATPQARTAGRNAGPGKLQFKIETARIENATFHFLDREGQPLADLEGVTVNCPVTATAEAHGAATIRKATFHGAAVVEGISTPFSFSNGRLTLPQIDARMAGGSLRGSYSLAPDQDNSPFTLDLLFDGVDFNRLLADLSTENLGQTITGTLQGSLDLYGQHGQQKSLGGSGQVVLRNGRMEQYAVLQMIGEALQIDELIHLDLREAQLDFRLGEGKAFIDSLVLESPNLSISATGTTGLEGKRLDLAARLTVDPNISRRVPGWVQSNFQPLTGSDRKLIPFRITGSIQHPDTDLVRNLVGQKYAKEVMDVYRLLTGGSRHKKKSDKSQKTEDKNTEAAAQPTAAPSPSPSASAGPTSPPVTTATSAPSISPVPTASPPSSPSQLIQPAPSLPRPGDSVTPAALKPSTSPQP